MKHQVHRDCSDRSMQVVAGAAGSLAPTYLVTDRYSEATISRLINEELGRSGVLPQAITVDVGCGTGAVSRYFAARRMRVLGVDISSDMLNIARTEGHIPIRGRAEALPLESGSVNAAISVASWHHFEDKKVAMAEMSRVVEARGVVIIADVMKPDLRLQAIHRLLPHFAAREEASHSTMQEIAIAAMTQNMRISNVATRSTPIDFSSKQAFLEFIARRPYMGMRMMLKEELDKDVDHARQEISQGQTLNGELKYTILTFRR